MLGRIWAAVGCTTTQNITRTGDHGVHINSYQDVLTIRYLASDHRSISTNLSVKVCIQCKLVAGKGSLGYLWYLSNCKKFDWSMLLVEDHLMLSVMWKNIIPWFFYWSNQLIFKFFGFEVKVSNVCTSKTNNSI